MMSSGGTINSLKITAASHFSGNGTGALLAVADFNCPGEGIMKLDGNSSRKEDEKKDKKELHLVKAATDPVFPDEWDFLINNYAYGVMHPELVDSMEQLALSRNHHLLMMPATKTGGKFRCRKPVLTEKAYPEKTGIANKPLYLQRNKHPPLLKCKPGMPIRK